MKVKFKFGASLAIIAVSLLSLAIIYYFIREIYHQKQDEYEKTVETVMSESNYLETILRFQKIGPQASESTGMQITSVPGVQGSGGNKPVMYLYKRYIPDKETEESKKAQDDFDKIFNGTQSSSEDVKSNVTAGINAAIKGLADIDIHVYDSLLVAKLKDKGIETPYKLELNYENTPELDKATGTPHFSEKGIYIFKHELPLDSENTVRYVYTSSPFKYVYKSVSGVAALSLLALIIIILSLLYLISLISSLRRTKKMQDEFTHLVTHNMSNPIAIALASAESLKKDAVNAGYNDDKQFIPIIIRQLSRLNDQVSSILKPFKNASTSSDLLKQEVNIEEEIKGIIEQTGVAHPEVKFTMSIPREATVSADSAMFYDMITNLIQNAVKYSPTNPQVDVSYTEDEAMKYIAVKDNGKGMRQDQIKHIFDQYYKAEELPSTPGYGLGLYYVSQVIEKHKWNIRVDSQPGKGSVFTIGIPKQ